MAESPAYIAAVLVCSGSVRWLVSEHTEKLGFTELALVGGGLGLLILSRTNAILVLGLALVVTAVGCRAGSSRSHFRFVAASVITASLIWLLVTGAVSLLPSNRVSDQSDNLIDVALQGRFQFRSEPWDWRFWDKRTRPESKDLQDWLVVRTYLRSESIRLGTPFSHLERKWILDDMGEHPGKTLQMFAIRLLSLHTLLINSVKPADFHLGPFVGWRGYVTFHVLLNSLHCLLVTLSSVFLWQFRHGISRYWALWSVWVSLLVFHGIVYAEPRYLLPALPGMVLMSAVVLAGFFSPRSHTGGEAHIVSVAAG